MDSAELSLRISATSVLVIDGCLGLVCVLKGKYRSAVRPVPAARRVHRRGAVGPAELDLGGAFYRGSLRARHLPGPQISTAAGSRCRQTGGEAEHRSRPGSAAPPSTPRRSWSCASPASRTWPGWSSAADRLLSVGMQRHEPGAAVDRGAGLERIGRSSGKSADESQDDHSAGSRAGLPSSWMLLLVVCFVGPAGKRRDQDRGGCSLVDHRSTSRRRSRVVTAQ